MKKILLRGLAALSVILIGCSIGFSFFARQNTISLVRYREEIQVLQDQARHDQLLARTLLETGDFDLRLSMSHLLLEKICKELEGLEIISAKGNYMKIETANIKLLDGQISLIARGKFLWRLGLYEGPVEAEYQGFVRFADEERCRLDLRVIQARPLQDHLLPLSWLEPWLILRLQNRLKIPEFTLPLGFEHQMLVPDIQRTLEKHKVSIQVPERHVEILAQHPFVSITPHALTLVVGNLSISSDLASRAILGVSDASPFQTAEIPEINGDLTLALRMKVLSEILATGIKPERDLLVKADHIPKVWEQDKKVLGLKIHNQIDLFDVDGWLDIREAGFVWADNQWNISILADGQVEGFARGKAYGIGINLPFLAQPHLAEQVPVSFETENHEPGIRFADQPVHLDLEMETTFAGRDFTFNYPFEISAARLLENFSLPTMITEDIQVPSKIEKKKITEKRTLDITFQWRPRLPLSPDGFLVVEGALEIK